MRLILFFIISDDLEGLREHQNYIAVNKAFYDCDAYCVIQASDKRVPLEKKMEKNPGKRLKPLQILDSFHNKSAYPSQLQRPGEKSPGFDFSRETQ